MAESLWNAVGKIFKERQNCVIQERNKISNENSIQNKASVVYKWISVERTIRIKQQTKLSNYYYYKW